MRADLRPFYGHHWRSVTRPAILRRAGGRFSDDTDHAKYQGAAKCERCGHIDCLPKGRSELDVAHLVIQPGESGHDDPTNLAARCRTCHRDHDYDQWAGQYRAWLKQQLEQRIARKDAERPILILLDEFVQRGIAAQAAVDRAIEETKGAV